MEEKQRILHVCNYDDLECIFEGVHLSVMSGGFMKKSRKEFEKYKIYKCPVCGKHYIKSESPVSFEVLQNGRK